MIRAVLVAVVLSVAAGVGLARLDAPLADDHCGCPAPRGNCSKPCSACCAPGPCDMGHNPSSKGCHHRD